MNEYQRKGADGVTATAWCWMSPFLVILLVCLGCQPSPSMPPAAPPSGLTLRVVYREKTFLKGETFTAVDGLKDCIFENASKTQPITVEFPPSEIWMHTSDSKSKLSRTDWKQKLSSADWPAFAKSTTSFTLRPGEKRVFATPFAMDVVKAHKADDQIAPKLVFVFGASTTKGEAQEEAFEGTLVSESFWDDSNTTEVKVDF